MWARKEKIRNPMLDQVLKRMNSQAYTDKDKGNEYTRKHHIGPKAQKDLQDRNLKALKEYHPLLADDVYDLTMEIGKKHIHTVSKQTMKDTFTFMSNLDNIIVNQIWEQKFKDVQKQFILTTTKKEIEDAYIIRPDYEGSYTFKPLKTTYFMTEGVKPIGDPGGFKFCSAYPMPEEEALRRLKQQDKPNQHQHKTTQLSVKYAQIDQYYH